MLLIFFLRAIFKGDSCFSCGATPSRPLPATQPPQVWLHLLERAFLRFQKERFWGRKLPEKGWGGQGETRKKVCAKEGGFLIGARYGRIFPASMASRCILQCFFLSGPRKLNHKSLGIAKHRPSCPLEWTLSWALTRTGPWVKSRFRLRCGSPKHSGNRDKIGLLQQESCQTK